MPNKIQGVIIIEGHVQGLANARALGETGIPVIVVDKQYCVAQFSRYCKKFYKCPDFLSSEFVDFLIRLAQDKGLKNWILLPSNDHAVYTISKNKKRLESHFRIITSDYESFKKIYDKGELLEAARACGVPIPLSYKYSELLESKYSVSFPVLIKGKYGLTFYKTYKKKAFMAADETELNRHLEVIDKKGDIEQILIQELIPFTGSNRTISFTAFSIEGKIRSYWIGEKLREHPLQFGTATFCQSIDNEEVKQLSQILLKNLKYTGVCEIEYIQDPRDHQYRLIEINARTWLWVGLAKSCGINYPQMIYNYLHNIAYSYPDSYTVGMKWINYLTDIPHSLQAMFQGSLNLKDWYTSLQGKKVNAVFSWKDIFPAFAFLVIVLLFRKKRRTI